MGGMKTMMIYWTLSEMDATGQTLQAFRHNKSFGTGPAFCR